MSIKTISISGTHCTGKTTLIEQMKLDSVFKDYIFFNSPTRDAKKSGLQINNQSENYDETQKFCLSYDIKKIISTSIHNQYIFDRSILDTYIYTKYLFDRNKVSERVMKEVETNWLALKGHYDLFVIPSKDDCSFEKDGVRVLDDDFRDGVHQVLLDLVESDEGMPILFINGSTENRIQMIKQYIKTT